MPACSSYVTYRCCRHVWFAHSTTAWSSLRSDVIHATSICAYSLCTSSNSLVSIAAVVLCWHTYSSSILFKCKGHHEKQTADTPCWVAGGAASCRLIQCHEATSNMHRHMHTQVACSIQSLKVFAAVCCRCIPAVASHTFLCCCCRRCCCCCFFALSTLQTSLLTQTSASSWHRSQHKTLLSCSPATAPQNPPRLNPCCTGRQLPQQWQQLHLQQADARTRPPGSSSDCSSHHHTSSSSCWGQVSVRATLLLLRVLLVLG